MLKFSSFFNGFYQFLHKKIVKNIEAVIKLESLSEPNKIFEYSNLFH